MGHNTYKPQKDVDLYVVFDSVTDFPDCWGTRQKLLKWSQKEKYRYTFGPPESYEDRLTRADLYSSSSRIFPESWEENYEINWGGYGYIYRDDLMNVIEILNRNGHNCDDPEVLAFVVKWEDDE